ncbi:hypothetical protein SAE02_44720 [Skermanella aerolata]|uniref:Nudix hydrolase domain-containing protein n=1 Tax=Skermanella aerolata TaxID=393310 RepID=A0A512DV28_9PROT|nr:hypothetical protein SAE02_44720 [Skermanella aerolata]
MNGDRILMIRQYRFLPNALSWEIPGGTVEPGEDPAVSAQRECLEETGVLCEDLNPLITYWPGLDNVDNETTIYSCIKSRQVHPFQPNPSEVVEIAWMPLMDVMGMVMGGEIKDVFTQTAMLSFAYSRLRSG